MSVRNLQRLIHVPNEKINARKLSDFDSARLSLLKGEIYLPTLDAKSFDQLLDTLHLSYKALETLTGISSQRLLRYRKEKRFPPEVSLLLTILKNEREYFFSHFKKNNNDRQAVDRQTPLISAITKESALTGRLFEISVVSALRSGNDATVSTSTADGKLNLKPLRFQSD